MSDGMSLARDLMRLIDDRRARGRKRRINESGFDDFFGAMTQKPSGWTPPAPGVATPPAQNPSVAASPARRPAAPVQNPNDGQGKMAIAKFSKSFNQLQADLNMLKVAFRPRDPNYGKLHDAMLDLADAWKALTGGGM